MRAVRLALVLGVLASALPAQERPELVAGYIVTAEIKALAPELKAPAKATPEAQLMVGALANVKQLTSRLHLAQDFSRQEIVSTDFVLPAGTLVLHKGGDRFYVIADPKARNYAIMDAADLLLALEGGANIVNTQYQAKVEHLPDRKEIAGYPCRKSVVSVLYVSEIPFENDRVLVQQKNDVEVWHTSQLVSGAVLDHFFFKFQRDRTAVVRKALGQEIGFPMEVRFVVTAPAGKKAGEAQPGSFHYLVTEVKQEKKLDATLFDIPPKGYTRLERSPYFKVAAQ
jgi:hypothetical protein